MPGILAGSVFMRGVEDTGEIDIVLGEDGMHFRLPAGSQEISQDQL
jgi:hypothetical protein